MNKNNKNVPNEGKKQTQQPKDYNLKDLFLKYWWIIIIALSPIFIPPVRWLLIKIQNNVNISQENDFVITYITFLGVIGLIGTFWYNFQRLKRQDKQLEKQQDQIDIQIDQVKNQQTQIEIQLSNNFEVQYSTAITILGSESETARIGAIHTLKKIADKNNEFIQPVMDILCSHIKVTTSKIKYQENQKDSPSNEIQSCINVMFKKDGLFCKNYSNLENPDLCKSFLNGANFSDTICHNTLFTESYLLNANFRHSECYSAHFEETHSEGIDFTFSKLYFAGFWDSKLQGARFNYSQACGADLFLTDLTGASLSFSNFFNSDFNNTILNGARLNNSFLFSSTIGSISLLGAHIDPNKEFKDIINQDTKIDYYIFFNYYKKASGSGYYERALKDLKEIIDSKNAKFNLSKFKEIYDKLNTHVNIDSKQIDIQKEKLATKTGVLNDSEVNQAIIKEDWILVDKLSK